MDYLFAYAIRNKLISVSKLYELLNVAVWRETILKHSGDVRELYTCHEHIKKILYYDVRVYDEIYYKRLVIKNMLTESKQINKLYRLTFGAIQQSVMDSLDDDNVEEIIYFIGHVNIPNEFRLFLNEFTKFPSVHIHLYTAEFINKMNNYNKTLLKNSIDQICSTGTINNCLLLYPLMYSKHYKTNIKDIEYINILCYVDCIDANLNDIPDGDKYISLTIDLPLVDPQTAISVDVVADTVYHDLVLTYLKNITKSILNIGDKIKDFYYPQDLLSICKTFDKCILDLLQHVR